MTLFEAFNDIVSSVEVWAETDWLDCFSAACWPRRALPDGEFSDPIGVVATDSGIIGGGERVRGIAAHADPPRANEAGLASGHRIVRIAIRRWLGRSGDRNGHELARSGIEHSAGTLVGHRHRVEPLLEMPRAMLPASMKILD
jgi:hypothetical protein